MKNLKNIIPFIFAAIFTTSCGNAPSPTDAPDISIIQNQSPAPASDDDFYNTYTVTLDVDPENRYIKGIQKVNYKNKSAAQMDCVCFSINLNAFLRTVYPKPYLTRMENKIFENGVDYGYIDIANVTVNRETARYETSVNLLTVHLPEPLLAGEQTEIMLQFEATIPKINHRIGANDYAVWCGNFLPTLRVYNENGWNTAPYYPVGDPFVTDIANYNVTINTPSAYAVIATGIENAIEDDEIKSTSINVKLVRDFAFVVSDKYIKSSLVTENGVEVNFYAYSQDLQAEKFLQASAESLDYYSNLVANYPYKQLDIAETGLFLSGGMAYPQLIFMDSDFLHTDSAARNLTREIGHQWFYNIVGNNQITEAWLDEGLTSFLQEGVYLTDDEIAEKLQTEYDALKEAITEIENKGLIADLGVYKTWQDYYNIQYRRAKLMFYSLKNTLGEEKFNELIKQYYLKYSYKTAAKNDFVITAEEIYGEPLTEFFGSWLGNFDLPPLTK